MNEITQKIREHVISRDFASDAQVLIRTNQLGFRPNAPKVAVLETEGSLTFRLIECTTGKVVDEQIIQAEKKDFGCVAEYRFSHITAPGTYYIQAGKFRSYPFHIRDGVLDDAFTYPVTYFAAQRCGPSTTGYMTPCHCEDGIRMDNGKRQDVTGGWHDASDLRKWVSATIEGMVGLAMVYELQGDVTGAGGILEELQWGNRYFLNMQEPEGYVMKHCGGDVFTHSDSNHWTDNEIGTEDDRVICTDPEGMAGQFRFITAQAMTARVARTQGDEAYAQRCLEAADRCLSWCMQQLNDDITVEALGDGMTAGLELYRTTGQGRYLNTASRLADRIMELQVHDYQPVRGFFRTSRTNPEPYRNIVGDPVGIGLCLMLEHASNHPDAERWRFCLQEWVTDYIVPMQKGSGYGLVPFGLYSWNAGGERRCGDKYYFRYFMGLHDQIEASSGHSWWVGINAHAAAMGIAMAKASVILEMPELLEIAQRQLDWILGANPFDESTMDLVGRNHHTTFDGKLFVPNTPRIRGAVLNGLGGSEEDLPDMHDGSYHTCEYWTPMVCHTMWLAALLKNME